MNKVLEEDKMNKVCIMTSMHLHDDNRVFYKEVLSLRDNGYDVTYIAPGVNFEKKNGINYVPVKKFTNRLSKITSFYYMYKLAKKCNCNSYHIQDSVLMVTGIMLKLFTKAKVIYDVHEDYPNQMLTKYYLKSFMRKPLYHLVKMLEHISDKLFDGIVVADNFVYKHFKNPNTIICYNFPKIDLYCQSEFDKTNKKYDIIFPGSMSKFTANLILDSCKMAKERGTILHCAMISPFKFDGGVDWVHARIKELGLEEKNFLIMGRIPPYEVIKYIKQSRIGLIPLPDTPKMRSNIPTKMFEYMYFGLPVVTGDLPPSAQFFKYGTFGILTQPDSTKDYTDAILKLLSDEKLIEQMGCIGNKLVLERFNWNQEEIKLINLYKKILEG